MLYRAILVFRNIQKLGYQYLSRVTHGSDLDIGLGFGSVSDFSESPGLWLGLVSGSGSG